MQFGGLGLRCMVRVLLGVRVRSGKLLGRNTNPDPDLYLTITITLELP